MNQTAPASVAPQGSSPDTRPDGFSWRLAAFYAAFFAFSGISMPFFPAWLQAKELDARATGIVLAVPMFMRLISVPSAARLADRRNALRRACLREEFRQLGRRRPLTRKIRALLARLAGLIA